MRNNIKELIAARKELLDIPENMGLSPAVVQKASREKLLCMAKLTPSENTSLIKSTYLILMQVANSETELTNAQYASLLNAVHLYSFCNSVLKTSEVQTNLKLIKGEYVVVLSSDLQPANDTTSEIETEDSQVDFGSWRGGIYNELLPVADKIFTDSLGNHSSLDEYINHTQLYDRQCIKLTLRIDKQAEFIEAAKEIPTTLEKDLFHYHLQQDREKLTNSYYCAVQILVNHYGSSVAEGTVNAQSLITYFNSLQTLDTPKMSALSSEQKRHLKDIELYYVDLDTAYKEAPSTSPKDKDERKALKKNIDDLKDQVKKAASGAGDFGLKKSTSTLKTLRDQYSTSSTGTRLKAAALILVTGVIPGLLLLAKETFFSKKNYGKARFFPNETTKHLDAASKLELPKVEEAINQLER